MTNMKNNPAVRRRCSITVALSLIGVSPGLAWSESISDKPLAHDPVREGEVVGVSISQGIKYDSNVFRIADETNTEATSNAGQRHDFISTTGLRVGLDKRFGRHRLYLLAAPSLVRYAEFDELNYVGQNFIADWSGRLGTDGRYGLNYAHEKVATNPADQLVPTGNIVTRDQGKIDVAIPTGARWHTVTGWRADRSRNSSPTEQGGDNDGWAGDAGVRFVSGSGNSADLRYRRSHYDYVNVIPSQLGDNSYTQNELELSMSWQPDQPSRFEGRASYLRRAHENFAERDFSGLVGSLGFIWSPTIDTTAALRVFRDLGAVTDSSASYAKTYGISFQPTWNLSAKLALGSSLEWRRRTYNGFTVVARAPENTAKVGLNARYLPTRNWELGLNVSDEVRTSSDPVHEYTDVITSLTARWKL